MPTRAKKLIAILFLGFLASFIVRIALGFFIDFPRPTPRPRPTFSTLNLVSSIEYRKDVANNVRQIGWQPGAISADAANAIEVYTCEARLEILTDQYDKDIQSTLAAIKTHDARVRFENTEGIRPRRSSSVVIRVPLDSFDQCVLQLKSIGEAKAYSVTKEDKTEETKRLIAERVSLISHRDALAKLRNSDGKVSERVDLESKIQEIQKLIEELDVNLGEFVKQESYNNIHFTMTEQVSFLGDRTTSPISSKALEALLWTCAWYFQFLCVVGLLCLVWLSITTLSKTPTTTSSDG